MSIDTSLALMDRPQVARDTPDHILPGAGIDTEKPETYEDHLAMVVRYFEQSEDMCREARKLSERDLDYVHNDQWTTEELAILRKRKQPALTINQVKRKVETMRGLERRQRSDPKAFPRTPNEEQAAEAATDALRFVADQNTFDEVRSQVYENMIIEGYGGCEVTAEDDEKGGYNVKVTRIGWDRLFYDPHSTMGDFCDAKYKGIVIWKDKTEALDEWPEGKQYIEDTLGYNHGETYEDKPRDNLWHDSKRTRIRVVQMHYREDGEWMICTFTKGGFLVNPQISPYKGKDGRSASSLILRSMYVDRNNNRYGHVRDLISLQDEINKRRSKALHLLSVRQSYGNRQAIGDVQKARNELAKPDGHIEVLSGEFGKDFGVLPTGDMAQGQLALLQQATAEMVATGANAALAGTDPRDQSGRAQQLQQQAGQVTLEPGLDALRHWTREVYEAIWMRVREFWTEEKWIRVTDDERNIKWVGLNKKITLEDKLKKLPPDQAQQVAQQTGIQSPYDPKLKQVVGVDNEVSNLDVDIIIEEGPDIASLQSEQFEALAGLAKNGIAIPPKAIIQASSIRNKDAILDEMEKGSAPSPQIQKQIEEMKQALQEKDAQLQEQDQKLQALTLKDKDTAEGNSIDAYRAETERLKLTAPVMTPEQIQLLVMQSVQDALSTHLTQQQPMQPPPMEPPPDLPPMGPPDMPPQMMPPQPDQAPPGAF